MFNPCTMQECGMSSCTLPLPVLILAEYFCNVCPRSDISVVLAGMASGSLNDRLVFEGWKEHVDNGAAGLQFGTLDIERCVGVAGLLDNFDPVASGI